MLRNWLASISARFLSDLCIPFRMKNVWKERVTERYKEMNYKDVATWERIQHQRERFREWEPGTALFIDAVNPLKQIMKLFWILSRRKMSHSGLWAISLWKR